MKEEETQKGICILGFIAVLFTTVAREPSSDDGQPSEITWAHSEHYPALKREHLTRGDVLSAWMSLEDFVLSEMVDTGQRSNSPLCDVPGE